MKAKMALIKTIGWLSCQKLFLSELGEISWSEGEHYNEIIKNSTLENNDRYYMYIRAAYVLTEKHKYENSIANLEKANELYPTALVSNFMIAQSYERLGEAEKAISAYEKAMNDPCSKSIKIIKYLYDQIQRVQT